MLHLISFFFVTLISARLSNILHGNYSYDVVLAPPTARRIFIAGLLDAPQIRQWLMHVAIQRTVLGHNFSPTRTRHVCCHGNTIRLIRVSCCIWRSGCLWVNVMSVVSKSQRPLFVISLPARLLSLPASSSLLSLRIFLFFILSCSVLFRGTDTPTLTFYPFYPLAFQVREEIRRRKS